MLFTYGRTAPTVPRTTPTRRNHHPSPGPHDHTAAGPDVPWAPQNRLGRGIRQNRRPVPRSAAIAVRRRRRPREGDDVLVRSRNPTERPEWKGEGHEHHYECKADGKTGRPERKDAVNPCSPRRSGGHRIPLKEGDG